jgi:mannan endo-1,4-beta-mannosidase
MVDTGEEGFDTTTAGYSAVSIYGNQTYLFDGTIGVAFTRNSADPNIDFASAHLYPEDWKFSFAAGNNWIADHIAIARGLGKPLVLGEFGVSSGAGLTEAARASVLAGWLNTFETQKGGGALFWQLLCPACRNYGDRFATVHSPDTSISNVLGPAATLASAGPAYVSSTTGTSGRRSSQ